MKEKTEKLLTEAIDLVRGADHVLANTNSTQDVNPNDCYDIAYKLERACDLLRMVGDRKYRETLDNVQLPEGVPF